MLSMCPGFSGAPVSDADRVAPLRPGSNTLRM